MWVARVAVLGGVSSLLVTGFWVATGRRLDPERTAGGLWVVEAVVLLVLIFLVVRSAGPRPAAVGALLAGIALPVSLFRFGPLRGEALFGSFGWALAAVVAALAGGYLRALNTGRQRAVEQARLQQRLELASDLHDFVAHDVSEILAQTQAAQILVTTEPGRLPLALERIHTAATRALDTLDRTVHGATEERSSLTGPDLATAGSIHDIPLLAARFQSSGMVRVELEFEAEAVAVVDSEAGRALYRAVVEALTNVRRHAGKAEQVRIRLRAGPTAGQVELSVTDDASHDARPAAAAVRTGLGLTTLSDRIQALGGTISAGPGEDSGWCLRVTLPLSTETATAEKTWSR
jgi:signal transduction histidine kinase